MRLLNIFVTVVFVAALASVASATAGTWTDESSTWNLGSAYGQLEGNGTNLYYFTGTTVKSYNWNGTWTPMTSDPYSAGVTVNSASGTNVSVMGGKFYVYNNISTYAYIDVFNPSGNSGSGSWSQLSLPTSDPNYKAKAYGQGSMVAADGKLYCFWTGGGQDQVASYNGTSWSAIQNVTDPTLLSYRSGVAVGSENYAMTLPSWQIGKVLQLNIDNSPPIGTQPNGNPYTPDSKSSLSSKYITLASNFSTVNEWANYQLLAVSGTTIYAASGGSGNPGYFLSYDTVHDTWSQLPSYISSGGDANGEQGHSMTVANNYVILKDGGQYLMYSIPEPATMALLIVGGAMALLRRRK